MASVFFERTLMRIIVACFADLRNGGGGATLAKGVADGLLARGHSVRILSRAETPENIGQDEYNSMPVEHYYVPAEKFWRVPSLGRSGRLAKVLRKYEQPDAFLGVSPYLMNAARKVWPEAWRVYLFPCLLYRCLKFTNPRPDIWARIDRCVIGMQEKAALQRSDRVIFQSPVMRDDAMDFAVFDPDKAVVCPYGSVHAGKVPAAGRDEVRKKFATPADAFVLLCAGSLDANKNVGWIIESLAKLERPDVWLWISGDGPQKEELIQKTAKLGLSGRVKFLGWQDDMPGIYGAADLMVHAAWYDALPYVCMEAMSFALPVIGPANDWPKVTSSMEYMINDGRQGWIYDLLDPDGLANALRKALANRSKLTDMGKSAQKREQSQLSWDNYVTAVEGALLCE